MEFAKTSILTPWLAECPSALFANDGHKIDVIKTKDKEMKRFLIALFRQNVVDRFALIPNPFLPICLDRLENFFVQARICGLAQWLCSS